MGPSKVPQLLLSTSLLHRRKNRVMVTPPTGVRSATSALFILKHEDSIFGYLELWVVAEVKSDWSVSAVSVPTPAHLLLRPSHGQLVTELELQSQI